MHREERDELSTCAGCGAEISPSIDRGYSFGSRGVVCWECAIKRGGSYDAEENRWTQPPDVADLDAEGFEVR